MVNSKKRLFILLFFLCGMMVLFVREQHFRTKQENTLLAEELQSNILRFHVKANSNSKEDISLKYKVRDAILWEVRKDLQDVTSREKAILYLEMHQEELENVAKHTIEEAGYDYSVQISLKEEFFPIRQYGNMVIPAGEYDAFCVDIGLAKGENFWCILYPMTCYTVESAAVVSETDQGKIKQEISEEDYQLLFVKRDVKEENIKYKCKLLEWLGL